MADRYPNINKHIEETLSALDEVKKAEPRPFFYTRLQARMEKEERKTLTISWSMVTPIVGLAIMILLNVVTLQNLNGDYQAGQDELDVFASAYGLEQESDFQWQKLDE